MTNDSAQPIKTAESDRPKPIGIDPAAYEGDIVSRLRHWRGLHLAHTGELFEAAADEIERLRLNDARLAALEELSALDQALELQHGLTGNPMIKAQERTPPTQPTPGDCSLPRECIPPVYPQAVRQSDGR